MNKVEKSFKPINGLLAALLVAAFVAGCGDGGGGGGGTGGSGPGPAGASPTLGAAAPYGIFVGNDAAVTLEVDALVDGDLGLMDGGGTCNNCTGLTVTGAIENGTPAAVAAKAAIEAAYTDASTRTANACTLADASELANAQGACVGLTPGTPGPTYGPGLYRTADPIGFSGTITLDAGGNSNAVFIFQTDAALTTQSNSTVVLANGAQARNVWWVAGSAATLGLSSSFKGTVVATAGVTVGVGSTIGAPTQVNGRVFSRTAAATVGEFTTITVP
jgi:hypothetical protein